MYRQLTIQQEAEIAFQAEQDTFRSQWPCKMFHLANRCTYSLECMECKRLRQEARKQARLAARLGREAREAKPGRIVRPSLKMQKHGLRAPAQKVPGADTETDKQRRIANANKTRERTRKQRTLDGADPDAPEIVKPVPTWYTPSILLNKNKDTP